MLSRYNDEPFLHRGVTYDDKLIFYDDPRRPHEWVDVVNKCIAVNTHVSVRQSNAGYTYYNLMNSSSSTSAEMY